jgi:hypothetical protein
MRYYFGLILILLSAYSSIGQEVKVTRDFESWNGIEFEKRINKRYDLLVEQETRFNRSLSSFKSSLIEIKMVRDCGGKFEMGVSGRYKLFNKGDDGLQNRIRYGVFGSKQIFKTKRLKAKGTIKYQREFLSSFNDYDSFWKFKLKLSANLKNGYKPYFSSEIFRVQELCRTPYFETIRLWIGTKKMLKKNEVSVALGYDHELNSKFPKSIWMLKLNYCIVSK